MNPRIVLQPQAERDITLQTAWLIREAGFDVADRFVAAVARTAELVLATPGMGAPRSYRNPRLAGVRMVPVRDFARYLLFYRPAGDRVNVVRLLHGARDLEALFRPGQ
jgi:toxin ParE1/3/4